MCIRCLFRKIRRLDETTEKNLFNFGIDPNWLFLYTLERVRKRKLLGGRLKWQVYHRNILIKFIQMDLKQ